MTEVWQPHAQRLAASVVRPESRWHRPLATVPRHLFTPRWWQRDGGQGWTLHDGPTNPQAWMRAAYADTTLVTRVGPLHADHAAPSDHPAGKPTSSSTLPSLVVRMYQHAVISEDAEALCVTGTGYGTALLAARLDEKQVTSVDVDPHLVEAATERLDQAGLHPTMAVCDITGLLPGEFDRIISTVSVRPIPASWLEALRPGGRLVTTIAGTGLIVTADKLEDGGAVGQVTEDPAGFMATRHGEDYEPGLDELFDAVRDREGEEVTTGRYPVIYVPDAWDVWSMLSLAVPGIEHRHERDGDRRTLWMLHQDGSWARATGGGDEPPEVHQGGPRRLWSELDGIRRRLNTDGWLPVYGAKVTITPDGETTLARGGWSATLAP
jgi:protein-L-isoaspartate O-methyltransferase